MAKKSNQNIPIKWNVNIPIVEPKYWYKWPKTLGGTSTAKENKLEKDLSWPRGTFQVLKEAFVLGLDRYTGWDLSDIAESKKKKYVEAASVYKRGVHTSELKVKRKSGSYNISLHEDEKPFLKKIAKLDFVAIDSHVLAAWPFLEDDLKTVSFDISEGTKNMKKVAKIIHAWESSGSPKHWAVIGGGVLCDVAGMAAYLTGSQVTLVPTTVLAMVDASVGGKTGVNYLPYGKNQIGAFHFPKEVIVWSGWLKTLVDRHIKSGGGEALKHAFINGDKKLVKKCVKAFSMSDIQLISEVMRTLIQVKADIVRKDPGESGVRAVLNMGHTVAHALETVSNDPDREVYETIEHGEAVALGVCYSATLSHDLGYLSKKDCEYIWETMESSSCLPLKRRLESFLGSKKLDSEEMIKMIGRYMIYDKKQQSSKNHSVRFVLLKSLGKFVEPHEGSYTVEVTSTEAKKSWKTFLKRLT